MGLFPFASIDTLLERGAFIRDKDGRLPFLWIVHDEGVGGCARRREMERLEGFLLLLNAAPLCMDFLHHGPCNSLSSPPYLRFSMYQKPLTSPCRHPSMDSNQKSPFSQSRHGVFWDPAPFPPFSLSLIFELLCASIIIIIYIVHLAADVVGNEEL